MKNKHLTLDDRIEIQECLEKGMTFKAIGRRVGKDQTTISKEIKKHIWTDDFNLKTYGRDGRLKANPICPQLLKPPFVCNPCRRKRGHCDFQKQFYRAKHAQKAYETLLVESREGIPLNKEEFWRMDRIVSENLKKGQHLYHIIKSNDIGVSQSTIYRHLKRGYLSVSPLDFPRVVKFKARKKHRETYIPKISKIGRTYEDFLNFKDENGVYAWVELDTVIGKIGGKVIMTFTFTFCNFMFGILLDNKTALEVGNKFIGLREEFARNSADFASVFPILLTDNGGEFADISTIENGLDSNKETLLFFCDPYQSSQKPKIEKNHTLFRDICPKGHSFDNFSQENLNVIFSHINSVKRKSLGGKTALDIFSFTHGEQVASLLGITPIPANEVNQSPLLLKRLGL